MEKTKIPLHLIFVSAYFLAAILTLIPSAGASKICLLGYKALCSFSPIGTVILIALGVLHIVLHKTSTRLKLK
jgi:hypothetical protein